MRLRTSFRLSVAASITTVAALALLMAWSIRSSSRASEAEDFATALQREVLERSILRDEYLLYGNDRARQQWEAKSAALGARLQHASEWFEASDEREALADMTEAWDRTRPLFSEIVKLHLEQVASAEESASSAALRERLTGKLILLSHNLSARASQLLASSSRRQDRTEQVTIVLACVLIATVLVIVVANATLASRLIERRIARLRAGAERIASGAFTHRIAMAGNDELAELAAAFDDMAQQLETQMARLASKNRELEAANRELEAFSYSVSHDLRAPIRHITGFVELLEKRAPAGLDEKSRHYLRVISDASRKMGALIDDLLSFSRMARAELVAGRVPLGPLVDGVIGDLARDADGRQVVWDVAPLPEVSGDAAMLRQVWFNLIANALKFSRSRPSARIQIGALTADGEVRCFVRDNGVGFDMKYANKLFGVFQRLHREADFEGTGVGLANVQRIVHRHGGRAWAEATPGQGAVFWFSLPMHGG
jgi:signal transduction histidine kinase